jgi:hypothetical protein
MFPHNNIVNDSQALPCPFANFLGGKEGIEDEALNLGGNASASILNPNLHDIADES